MLSLMVDQESKKAQLEGEHIKKEVQYCGLKKEKYGLVIGVT